MTQMGSGNWFITSCIINAFEKYIYLMVLSTDEHIKDFQTIWLLREGDLRYIESRK